jgi:hypothetical protein
LSFFTKNDHFYEEKWNFHFLKDTNKKKDRKKYIIALDTFFIFLLCFKNKIKKIKVRQKIWAFNIFLKKDLIVFSQRGQ